MTGLSDLVLEALGTVLGCPEQFLRHKPLVTATRHSIQKLKHGCAWPTAAG